MTPPPGPSWRRRLRVIGYHDLERRPGFKLAMQVVGDRWYDGRPRADSGETIRVSKVANAAGTAQWTAGDAFTIVQSFSWWSSTTYDNGPATAWYVSFSDGDVGAHDKTVGNVVLPARGGS